MAENDWRAADSVVNIVVADYNSQKGTARPRSQLNYMTCETMK